jgi:hypothetical protein
MGKDDHPEPERPAVPAPEMTTDNHLEPEQRSLCQQLHAAGTRVQESADTFRRAVGDLPERLPSLPAVAMPSMPALAWRDWVLFGFTGASILVALVTFIIVLSDMLGRGTH